MFYIIIALEFFYMASPFAIYFYSIYSPALTTLNESPSWGWLISFFLPHIAQTSSVFINSLTYIGVMLAVLGFGMFVIGASQVYYYKLTKKGAVTGGIYKIIRHPQYSSLIICSFGLLLLWPRYLVLIMFITILFAYNLLARVEEKECEAKFGKTFVEYKAKTRMFFPIRLRSFERLRFRPKSTFERAVAVLTIYMILMGTSLGIARIINSLSINSLYTYYTDKAIYLSISRIGARDLEEIVRIINEDEVATKYFETKNGVGRERFLNYVLPKDWYASEIPMIPPDGVRGTIPHRAPSNYDRNMYKVILTKVAIRGEQNVTGGDMLMNITTREPIVEIWVNMAQERVIGIKELPPSMYGNIPVALY